MKENAIEMCGSFSWGFTEEKKEKDKKKVLEQKEKQTEKNLVKEEKTDEVVKPLSDFLPLKNLNIKVKKGEFVCVIGDVGSGKSSLFSALIGDMIYVPQAQID